LSHFFFIMFGQLILQLTKKYIIKCFGKPLVMAQYAHDVKNQTPKRKFFYIRAVSLSTLPELTLVLIA